jgi:hypothetical protein
VRRRRQGPEDQSGARRAVVECCGAVRSQARLHHVRRTRKGEERKGADEVKASQAPYRTAIAAVEGDQDSMKDICPVAGRFIQAQ